MLYHGEQPPEPVVRVATTRPVLVSRYDPRLQVIEGKGGTVSVWFARLVEPSEGVIGKCVRVAQRVLLADDVVLPVVEVRLVGVRRPTGSASRKSFCCRGAAEPVVDLSGLQEVLVCNVDKVSAIIVGIVHVIPCRVRDPYAAFENVILIRGVVPVIVYHRTDGAGIEIVAIYCRYLGRAGFEGFCHACRIGIAVHGRVDVSCYVSPSISKVSKISV